MHGVLLGFGGAHDLFGQPSRLLILIFGSIKCNICKLGLPLMPCTVLK